VKWSGASIRRASLRGASTRRTLRSAPLRRALAAPLCLAAAAGLSACFATRPSPESVNLPVAPVEIPPAPAPRPESIPDAVPKVEARSKYGNPPFYEVFGQRYYVLSSSVGYVERGVASWYGPGFHKVRTSVGEPYDMYAMTAAHKTLPLPAYVRVTNLQNGRSVVVRVNDRGPFVDNRIIDLSYSAALKLDVVRNGTAFVEVRSIDPAGAQPAEPAAPAPLTVTTVAPVPALTAPLTPAAANAPLFMQAGAFSDPENAKRLAAKLGGGGYGTIFVRDDEIAGRRMYRVRIGPIQNVAEFDRVLAALKRDGVRDAHLALE
jgi:rare lipoprotein A